MRGFLIGGRGEPLCKRERERERENRYKKWENNSMTFTLIHQMQSMNNEMEQ